MSTEPAEDRAKRLKWEFFNDPSAIIVEDLTEDEATMIAALVAGPLPSEFVRFSAPEGTNPNEWIDFDRQWTYFLTGTGADRVGVTNMLQSHAPQPGKTDAELCAEHRATERAERRATRRAGIAYNGDDS